MVLGEPSRTATPTWRRQKASTTGQTLTDDEGAGQKPRGDRGRRKAGWIEGKRKAGAGGSCRVVGRRKEEGRLIRREEEGWCGQQLQSRREEEGRRNRGEEEGLCWRQQRSRREEEGQLN